LGAICFAAGTGSPESLRITTCPASVIVLARGVCTKRAPANSASYFISRACKLAHETYGWDTFIAYADEQANEVGAVYQTANWRHIGKCKQGRKMSFTSPDGKSRFSSYDFSKRRETKFYAIGWNGVERKYKFLRRLGYIGHVESVKSRYVLFMGRRKKQLEKCCRFAFLTYPKRLLAPGAEIEVTHPSSAKEPVNSVGFDEFGEAPFMAAD
jgi:hypothetical protein